MRLSKRQLLVVDVLNAGGWVCTLGGKPYLAQPDGQGGVKTKLMHTKTFEAFVAGGIITQVEGSNRYEVAR